MAMAAPWDPPAEGTLEDGQRPGGDGQRVLGPKDGVASQGLVRGCPLGFWAEQLVSSRWRLTGLGRVAS